jgi:hypothetical protein
MSRFNGLVNRIGGQLTRPNLFWFKGEQWARSEPFIPRNRRSVKPKNNRRFLMIDAVYGRGGSDQIEAFIRRENVMDAARKMLGNSTTARQLITAGLAGRTLGAAQGDDLWSVLKGGAEGAAGGIGARKLVGLVDQRVARRVGEMLASNDTSVLTTGIGAIANSQQRLQALRDLDTRLAALLAARGGSALLPKPGENAQR